MLTVSCHKAVSIIAFLCALTINGGCAKVAHMQELLTLKALSDNQTQQAKYIEGQDKKFEKLLETLKTGQLQKYPNQKAILKTFGEPIFKKTMTDSSQEWLYRYAAKLFDSEKVYLYFDADGHLKHWKHIPPETTKKQSDT